MRMTDIIHKKRLGGALSDEELQAVVSGFVSGDIPDYQMSAFAMAVLFQGMTDEETTALTLAMARSGQQMDLSGIPGIKVDKHSTGGVGDKTTLVLAPLVASLGVPVAKMSGRGLGHTGGTIDKLESISGFTTEMSMDAFTHQVNSIGIAVAGQTGELAPADKKLYALRDVTDTVESIPLIASSIMSKKLASGAGAIVLDVKVGEGAFMKDLEHARTLARTMVSIGALANRQTVAVLTQMEEPLGRAVGNALEVKEAILTLQGQGPQDLTELCLTLGAEMVVQGQRANNVEEARAMLQEALANGQALAKFKEFVQAQGGDPRVADDLSLLPKAPVVRSYNAQETGVVTRMHAEAIGLVAMRLGAGRATKADVIRPEVGLVMQRKVGERVSVGEPLVEVHAQTEADATEALQALARCIEIQSGGSEFDVPLILDVVRYEKSMDQTRVLDLLNQAKQARETAYVPYSNFAVGAAIRLTNGQVFMGCNIENASYGLTNCAERTAIFKAVSEGAIGEHAQIQEVAVVADSDGPVAPCGACRQVLAEYCPSDTPILLADMKGHVRHTTMSELLPYAFGAAQMNKEE